MSFTCRTRCICVGTQRSFVFIVSGNEVSSRQTALLRHGEILREIIFYCWDNGLHEFQKYYQIHVDAEHFAPLFDRLDDFLHDVGVPGTQTKFNELVKSMCYLFSAGGMCTHLHGCTDAIFGPGKCGCVSIVTVFLA